MLHVSAEAVIAIFLGEASRRPGVGAGFPAESWDGSRMALTRIGRYRLALPPHVTSGLVISEAIFSVAQMPDFHLTPVLCQVLGDKSAMTMVRLIFATKQTAVVHDHLRKNGFY